MESLISTTSQQTVVSLSVPAGTYIVTGTETAFDNSTTAAGFIACSINSSPFAVVAHSLLPIPGMPGHSLADVTISDAVTLTSAGTISLSCMNWHGDGKAQNDFASLTAVQVGSLN